MRVLCKVDNGAGLSIRHFESGFTPSSKFDLQVGKEYVVYGISLWKGLLSYLIVGEGMYPAWYPPELFSITRNELPPCWHFSSFREGKGVEVTAIWGYEELVSSEDHFDQLSNLEKGAIEIFAERKREIDQIS